jgi:hypothetical protein
MDRRTRTVHIRSDQLYLGIDHLGSKPNQFALARCLYLACGRHFGVGAERPGCRGWLLTFSLPSYAMVSVLVHAILGIRRLPKSGGEARTPRIAWTRRP